MKFVFVDRYICVFVGLGIVCLFFFVLVIVVSLLFVFVYNVIVGDVGYIQEIWGVKIVFFMYLGVKYMVIGYDYILFLLGVVFFLYWMSYVVIYVSLFVVGYLIMMLVGVYFGWNVNLYVIDVLIGLLVVYKVLDNFGVYQCWFGFQLDIKVVILIFGLIYGIGLVIKIFDYEIVEEGLILNFLVFNVGVEIGQFLVFGVILIVMGYWCCIYSFWCYVYIVNVVMMFMGFVFMGYQIIGYFVVF